MWLVPVVTQEKHGIRHDLEAAPATVARLFIFGLLSSDDLTVSVFLLYFRQLFLYPIDTPCVLELYEIIFLLRIVPNHGCSRLHRIRKLVPQNNVDFTDDQMGVFQSFLGLLFSHFIFSDFLIRIFDLLLDV